MPRLPDVPFAYVAGLKLGDIGGGVAYLFGQIDPMIPAEGVGLAVTLERFKTPI